MPDGASDGVGRRIEGRVMVGMAGVGLDAAMVQDAPHGLKRRIGWPAYVVSLLRHLADRGFAVEIDVDGKRTSHRHVRTVVIGNVGGLHGGLSLFPDAQPDNGVLEVAVLAPRTVLGWISVVARLLRGRDRPPVIAAGAGSAHRGRPDSPYCGARRTGRPLADGRVLDVTVEPGALLLRVAAETAADAEG